MTFLQDFETIDTAIGFSFNTTLHCLIAVLLSVLTVVAISPVFILPGTLIALTVGCSFLRRSFVSFIESIFQSAKYTSKQHDHSRDWTLQLSLRYLLRIERLWKVSLPLGHFPPNDALSIG
jgi:hypothetical protein